jgi:hypothetical protein
MEYRSSPGCDARSQARTQGVFVPIGTDATEDPLWGANHAARRHRLYFVKPSYY